MQTTYDVRVYKTEVYRGKKVTTYYVRWRVGSEARRKPFRIAAQAETYRSELLAAARRGEAFSLATGEPVSWGRRASESLSWYDFACRYVDMKWKNASAKYRHDIARALVAATPAMLAGKSQRFTGAELRAAMQNWGFNTKTRDDAPYEIRERLKWLAENTRPVTDIAMPGVARRLLDAATSTLAGRRAAPDTVRKHRMLLANANDYAIELGILQDNHVRKLKWTKKDGPTEIDRRCVVNHAQARVLLNAVKLQKPSGPRLVAFFALMYYCALRPEEVIGLRRSQISLPDVASPDAWGELVLRSAAPYSGRRWTDDGEAREERALKHREAGQVRPVPIPPQMVTLLREHLDSFPDGADGRVFYGVRGGELPFITYRRAWREARKAALSTEDQATPLASRPYDLRHACVSTWLNAGVAPPQVAEWAGHSVDVLLRIYAKCIVGQDEVAKARIAAALADPQEETPTGHDDDEDGAGTD